MGKTYKQGSENMKPKGLINKIRCSVPLLIRGIKIKTIIRYHCLLIRLENKKQSDNHKYWKACRAAGMLIHCQWECKLVFTTFRSNSAMSSKVEATIIGPSNSFPRQVSQKSFSVCTQKGVYSSTGGNCVWKVRNWKQPK